MIELRRPTWSNARHAAQWENTLAAYAHPVIGNKTVDSITPADAMAVLTPIWTTKPETASRVRQRMETVMDWAITHGYRLDNPAGRSLLKVLPPVNRLKEHRQALPYVQVPGAVALVRECTADIPTKLAFEFLVLTAGRSVEVRAAEWSEIDREAAAWEATGQPTISGTAQVGETLTVDTTGIADTDGLDNPTFTYQWLGDDAAIAGATASAYTLTDADEGKAIKVQVSFTDDAGNDETLTSAATGAVDARPNNPATGAPTISGSVGKPETEMDPGFRTGS